MCTMETQKDLFFGLTNSSEKPTEKEDGPIEVTDAPEPSYGLVRNTSRRIVHGDLDSFYASVEQRDNPALWGRPIAVGNADGRGVVATASYEARRYGVHSAMPSCQAKRLCPEIIFVPARFPVYKETSAAIHEIFHRYSDLVEGISLDEAFLDVTLNKKGVELGLEVAKAIKADIRKELNLVASAGVSYCKFLAKIASDYRKPDGLCVIHPDKAQEFIDRLDVADIWGVGPVSAERFYKRGIHTGLDLRRVPLPRLIELFGEHGTSLYQYARGIDDRPVMPYRERKSVSCEETVEVDLVTQEEISALLVRVAEDLSRRMMRSAFVGKTLTLKLRHADFSTVSRAMSAPRPYDATVERLIEDGLKLLQMMKIPPKGIRLLGLRVASPVVDDNLTPMLWSEEELL